MTWNVFSTFYCVRPLALPSFEVVLERGEEGSFLNIYKLQGDSVAKGRGLPTQAVEETASPKKANQTNGTKSYFSDGYCKRSLCVLKNLLQPTLD